MASFLNADSAEDVLKLSSLVVDDFIKDVSSYFKVGNGNVNFVPLESWDKAEGEKIVILPYTEISEDGNVYFLLDDILDAMDNPDLEKLKLISWEMILGKLSYILYSKFKDRLKHRSDAVVLANILASSTLIGIDDVKTLLAVLDAKLKTIRFELEGLEGLDEIQFADFNQQEAMYADAKARVLKASVHFIDAAIINWIALQSLSLAPLLSPGDEIINLIRENLFDGENILKNPGEVAENILSFYDVIKVLNKGRTLEITELLDKIMIYRRKLGLDYYPSTQEIGLYII